MQNPFNKMSEVTMMLVKKGHRVEGLKKKHNFYKT